MAPPRGGSPLRAGVTALVVGGLALAAVATLALALTLRSSVDPAGERVSRVADGLVPAASATSQARLTRNATRARVSARVVEVSGGSVIWHGSQLLLEAPAAGWAERLVAGEDRWSLREGVATATRPLPGGRRLVVGARLPAGVGLDGATVGAAYGLAGGLALLLALIVGVGRARLAGGVERLAATADALTAGRQVVAGTGVPGVLRPLAHALSTAGERMASLREAAESGVDGLAAALAPLAIPVAARTPAGRLIRNDALARELAGAGARDGVALEAAVQEGLGSSGPVARRLALEDGRVMEVEAWAVPGGRLVAIGERTESERLQTLRRQLEGVAARHLGAPVAEIKALGSELLSSAPASAAPQVARIMSAADRMERLVATLLRGTPHDPRSRPLSRHPVGAAGFLWGLSHAWDRALRPQALRVELEVDPDVPAMLTDAALVEEILVELIENAAKFTHRGGTITLAALPSRDGGVALEVRDTGGGFAPDELPHVKERFFRGREAAVLPGVGLGLGVASALAERLGGRLELSSGPGGLARLTLPAVPAPAPAPPLAEQERPAAVAETVSDPAAEPPREPVSSGSR